MRLGGLLVLIVLIHQESWEILTQEESCQTSSKRGEWLLLQCSAQSVVFMIVLIKAGVLTMYVMSSKKAATFSFF